MNNYFNVKDFDKVVLRSNTTFNESAHIYNSKMMDAASGKHAEYDVFISHSSKNKDLVRKLRQVLEDDYNLSAYIDWEEDAGTNRNDVADKIKLAMDRSKSLLYVKTSEADDSQWVAWEVGRYDHINNDKIGVLLIDDEKNSASAWKHAEFLKDYQILSKNDFADFVRDGKKKLVENKRKSLAEALTAKTLGVAATTGTIIGVSPAIGQSTKFFSSGQ